MKLSFDDKIKVWLDYVVTQSSLNNNKELIETYDNKQGFINKIHFPVLDCYWGLNHNIKILGFDDFVELRLSEWVLKFSKRIFKSN